MADYASEGREIRVSNPRDFRGTAVGQADVTSVAVEVFSADFSTQVLDSTPMDWDDDLATWVYTWDTRGLDPGSYKAKVTITSIDGLPSFEYQTIRLARDPHPA